MIHAPASYYQPSSLLLLTLSYQAEERLRSDPNLNHEYLPIAGLPEFTTASQKLVLGGDSPAIKDKRVSFSRHFPMA